MSKFLFLKFLLQYIFVPICNMQQWLCSFIVRICNRFHLVYVYFFFAQCTCSKSNIDLWWPKKTTIKIFCITSIVTVCMERRKKLSYLWYFGLEGEQMDRDVQTLKMLNIECQYLKYKYILHVLPLSKSLRRLVGQQSNHQICLNFQYFWP